MNNNTFNLNTTTIDPKLMQQLVFVFNAIKDGWSIRRVNANTLEFEKSIKDIPQKYVKRGNNIKDSFVFKFLRNNASMERALNQSLM